MDEAFYGLDERTTDPDKDYVYANPIINGRGNENTNIDIKMETGTGKTYVGVRAMYDLHQKYGLFKFIVVVPSPAIKEGWKNFITRIMPNNISLSTMKILKSTLMSSMPAILIVKKAYCPLTW